MQAVKACFSEPCAPEWRGQEALNISASYYLAAYMWGLLICFVEKS